MCCVSLHQSEPNSLPCAPLPCALCLCSALQTARCVQLSFRDVLGLTGSLPAAWGSQGSFPALTNFIVDNCNLTGEQLQSPLLGVGADSCSQPDLLKVVCHCLGATTPPSFPISLILMWPTTTACLVRKTLPLTTQQRCCTSMQNRVNEAGCCAVQAHYQTGGTHGGMAVMIYLDFSSTALTGPLPKSLARSAPAMCPCKREVDILSCADMGPAAA